MNHRFPSGPAAIPDGTLLAVGIGNSVTVPDGVIRPILLPVDSVNHRFPSGPAAIPEALAPGVGIGNSMIAPGIVSACAGAMSACAVTTPTARTAATLIMCTPIECPESRRSPRVRTIRHPARRLQRFIKNGARPAVSRPGHTYTQCVRTLALASGLVMAVASPAAADIGNGPVSVAVDAKGKPVGPPRLCPDCAPALLAGVSFVPELPVPPDSHGTAVASTLPDRAAGPVRLAARARGPPRIL